MEVGVHYDSDRASQSVMHSWYLHVSPNQPLNVLNIYMLHNMYIAFIGWCCFASSWEERCSGG